VTSVNDAPSGADITVTTLEDTDYVFEAADFGFTDPNDTLAPNILQSVIITTLPASGTLTLGLGASVTGAVTLGQNIIANDLQYLIYTPALDMNGASAATFTFQVVDDGD